MPARRASRILCQDAPHSLAVLIIGMPQLVVESGALAGATFSFDRRVVIGRGEIADVRLDDVTISRRHAEVRPAGDGWEVVDAGSANGVLLNDEPLPSGLHAPEGLRSSIRLSLCAITL